MEHPNAVRFREAHSAAQEGELDPLVSLLAEDVEWWDTGASEPTYGKAASRERIAHLWGHIVNADLHDLFANDEHLVALVHSKAQRAGQYFEYSTAEVCHMSADGLITKRQAFAHDSATVAAFFA